MNASITGLNGSLGNNRFASDAMVNTVNPGATDTGYATAELYESIRLAHPQKRWGQPEDAARLVG